jgi:tRNA threonylcarbamoyladenosine biosynthesis protein TsaE
VILHSWIFATPVEANVISLANCFRLHLKAPLVIYLNGELGAGKTTFARALIQSLGYPGRVKSPSYGLLEPYNAGGMSILHLDLYRIEDPAELDYLAIRDLFDHKSILLVEWPNKGKGFLPPPDVELHLDEADLKRFVNIKAYTEKGQSLSGKVKSDLKGRF